jgi:hypothetical protein
VTAEVDAGQQGGNRRDYRALSFRTARRNNSGVRVLNGDANSF